MSRSVLTLFAALSLGIMLFVDAGAVRAQTPDISVTEAHNRALSGELVLVDIRAPKEWRASGLPASGKAITMYQRGDRLVRALQAATSEDPDKPIALICATGVRSLRLQRMLRSAGFKNVINVLGGMFGTSRDIGWLKAGLPIRTWRSE